MSSFLEFVDHVAEFDGFKCLQNVRRGYALVLLRLGNIMSTKKDVQYA